MSRITDISFLFQSMFGIRRTNVTTGLAGLLLTEENA
jgi:hypothetical protein